MIDVSEKEIVYEFDMRNPESSYTKPIFGKRSRIILVLMFIAVLVIAANSVVLMTVDRSSLRIFWLIVPIMIAFEGVKVFLILPHNRRKHYKKVHAENEDLYSYTFYTDCVKIQSPSVDAVLDYDSAEYYAEDADRLRIVFSLGRSIDIDKTQCDEEKLAFFRNIVSKESQKKFQKNSCKKLIIHLIVVIFVAVMYAFQIAQIVNTNKQTYYSEYQNTTYESFEACLNEGTIKDVVIINDKYVEYTFINYTGDERYYTVCPDEIEHLIQKLDDADVNWEKNS